MNLDRYLARLDRRADALTARSSRFSRVRLAIVGVGTVAVIIAAQADGRDLAWYTGFAFAALFMAAAVVHGRLERGRARLGEWRAIKARHHARRQRDWAALPLPPTSPVPPDHPFAVDLRVVGARSLQHLMDTSVSEGGHRRLVAWLLQPVPDRAQTLARQAKVRALIPLQRLRDKMALAAWEAARDAGARWDTQRLLRWVSRDEEVDRLRRHVIGLTVLALVTLGLLGAWLLGEAPGLWGVTFVLYLVVYGRWFEDLKTFFDEAQELEMSLRPLGAVLGVLKAHRFASGSVLADHVAPLHTAGADPEAAVRRVGRVAGAAALQANAFLSALLNTLGPWTLYFAYRLRVEKRHLRQYLPGWLEVWHDVEALSALANLAALHPEAAFPEIVEAEAEGSVLTAEGIGHPLLPPVERVDNTDRVDALGTVTIITGSNMSGKSTYLRTLGLNLCLAYAGGPVMAQALRVRPFRLFTCLNVSDSVSDGISYFYAEVKRLQALLTSLRTVHPIPQLSLIDEIFRGTNNRERLLGSQAYVEALAAEAAVAYISTHDLELVELETGLPGVRNLHFREDVAGGRMVFDYRLRSGPCPTTNALKIMALEGLPVPDGVAKP